MYFLGKRCFLYCCQGGGGVGLGGGGSLYHGKAKCDGRICRPALSLKEINQAIFLRGREGAWLIFPEQIANAPNKEFYEKRSPVVIKSLQTTGVELSLAMMTEYHQCQTAEGLGSRSRIKNNKNQIAGNHLTLLAQDSQIQEKLPGFCAGPAGVELFLFFPVSMLGEEVVGLSFSVFEWEE